MAILTLALFVIAAPAARAAAPCSDWHAELTAVEGTVDVKRAADSVWRNAPSGTSLCYGDAISVKASSRATLTLPDHSTLRLDENTTITLVEPEQSGGSLIDLLRGVIHVISRDPRSLKFTTPYANAGLEGTEFDIRVSEREPQTEVVVLEGKVAMSTPQRRLERAERADRGRSCGPTAHRATPAGSRSSSCAGPDTTRASSIDRYRPRTSRRRPLPMQSSSRGAPPPASKPRESTPQPPISRPRCGSHRRNRLALALQAIMALARADHDCGHPSRDGGNDGAERVGGSVARALLCAGGRGRPRRLDASATRAAALEPDNALALSRMARWHWHTATSQPASSTRRAPLVSRPSRAEPLTVLGFAYLSQLDSAAARNAFERAVELEPAAPLPRLGRGLALIQGGDLIGGRQQIELAVASDPTNSLARSYMSKVYEAENRAKLPGSQLDLAKRFDPLDPDAVAIRGAAKAPCQPARRSVPRSANGQQQERRPRGSAIVVAASTQISRRAARASRASMGNSALTVSRSPTPGKP